MQNKVSDHHEKSLLAGFVSVLEEATGVSVIRICEQVQSEGSVLDAVVEAAASEEQWHVPIEILNEGYPRDVRDAAWTLEGYRARLRANAHEKNVIPMVIAKHLSKGAREELKVRNIGYYDSSGSMHLRHDRWLIHIERPYAGKKEVGTFSLFSRSREKVIHALLHLKGDWFTGYQLAEASETSVYSVSVVLKELEKLEWLVTSDGRGRDQRRKLSQPGKLLDAWAAARQKSKETKSRWYLFSSSAENLLTQVSLTAMKSGIPGDWAVTGAAAANALSPLLTGVDVAEIAIPSESVSGFVAALALRPAEKGSNIVLIERSGAEMLFRQKHERTWFASPFIQYIDLLDGRGRNKELAARFRADILRI